MQFNLHEIAPLDELCKIGEVNHRHTSRHDSMRLSILFSVRIPDVKIQKDSSGPGDGESNVSSGT